jgi:lysozyme family protein
MADPPFEDLQPEYSQLWTDMQIRPEKQAAVAAAAARITGHKTVYKAVMAEVGVPWAVVGIIHSLEADNNMGRHLHNGNPLTAQTTDVPSGRPPTGTPPFNWKDSAVDALKLKKLDAIKEWPVERIAYEFERYNGWGYRKVGGGVKSAYLWSFTNHHLKGKFVRDHVFDPDAPSDQVGAMALLKHLMDSGVAISGGGLTVEVKTKPIESNIFMPLGPFELLPTRDAPPADNPVIIEENEQCKKIREHGAIWEIDVLRPDGTVKNHGFAHGSFFKPLAPEEAVDIDSFARLCLTSARLQETSAHHLVAVADLETGIRNVAAVSGDGAGPFLIGADAWAKAVADGALGIAVADRLDPYSQPAVAAKMTVDATTVLKTTITDRLPTSAELYIAHLVGADKIVQVLSDRGQPLKDVLSRALGEAQADILKAVRPWLFAGNASTKDVLTSIARKLDFGYERADQMFARVEPDFEVATASDFADRVRRKALEEWEFFGKQTHNASGGTVKAGHQEDKARLPLGSGENWFDRVGKYWRAVGDLSSDGRTTDKPWSAAFISYVLKECEVGNMFRGSAQHSVYVSQAIRDFKDQAKVAYWCQRLNECKPAVGDIVCWAREDGVDYDHQKGGEYKGHCDFVIEVRPGEIDVIGGNVGQSVTRRPLALDTNDHLKPVSRPGERLFAIMQNQIK